MDENKLTVEQVRARVAEIAALENDPEAAHSAEDDLYADVLEVIAAGSPDAALLAAEVLKTQQHPHRTRWFA